MSPTRRHLLKGFGAAAVSGSILAAADARVFAGLTPHVLPNDYYADDFDWDAPRHQLAFHSAAVLTMGRTEERRDYPSRAVFLLGHGDGTGELTFQSVEAAGFPFLNGSMCPMEGRMISFDLTAETFELLRTAMFGDASTYPSTEDI